jgi:hypothetical protein
MAHADDETLSALLDTEATPGEAAHVDTCAQCQSRLAALRGAATAVATPVAPVPRHVREAAVSMAVRGVTEVRTRRSVAAQRRMSGLSAAAALVVAVAVGGWAISQIGSGAGHKTDANSALSTAAGTASKSATPTGGLGGENSAIDSSGGATTSPMAAPPYDAGDIGAFDTVALVSQHAGTDLSQSPDAIAAKSTGAESPCPYAAGVPVWQATLSYNGEAAVAHLVKVDDAKQVMQVLRRADCAVIASQDFVPTTPR